MQMRLHTEYEPDGDWPPHALLLLLIPRHRVLSGSPHAEQNSPLASF